MDDFLTFKKMITPLIIQIIFWIGVALCVVGAIGAMAGGAVLSGLLTLIVGPLIVRIYCEVLIVLFCINDTLTDIKNKMRDTIA